MTARPSRRRGRCAVNLAWLGALAVCVLAGTGRGPVRSVAQTVPAAGQAASRDTTGQAALRWQTERPQRAASLLRAERTIYRVIGGEAVTYYYGNVYLDRDTVVVRADSAHVYRERDLTRLFANVRIRHHETRIACDWAEYRRNLGEADLRGNVRVVEALAVASARRGELRDDLLLLRLLEQAVLVTPEYTIQADTLVRDRRQEFGEAFGRVRITDPAGETVITGDHGLFANDGSWAEVDHRPRLWTYEQDKEPVESTARLMRLFRAEDRAVLIDSVQIIQGSQRAFADTAVSYGRDHVELRGSPRLFDGERTRMAGALMDFFYREGSLERVIMRGQARMEDTEPDSLAALYAGLPALDVMEGDSIAVHFRDGEIYRTDVIGQAHSVYVPLDLDDEVAFNEVQGDTLILRFQDRRVREVEVIGNMSGTYHFARLDRLRGPRPALPDSQAASAANDSLRPANGDTTATAAAATADEAATFAGAVRDTLDFAGRAERVDYSGHRLLFDFSGRTINVSRDAQLAYDTMTLQARDVILDTETRELYADGDARLEDGEVIIGRQMGYDFGHRTGAVRQGVTTFDGYYYVGDQVNRYPDGSLKICSGKMTSCDLAEPHYHFWSHRMKIRLGDRVVAAPIVIKIGHVPIFALPFYFKSLKEGRRSGIMFPNFNFGWSSREGRYIRDFGYYWATNDYTDFTFEIDYNERRELAWRVRNQYVKRYAFSGSLEYNDLRGLRADEDLREWQLRWAHDQPKLFDDYRFRSDVEMASRELSRNNLNQDRGRDVISGQLKSNIYLSRNFGFGGASLNASRTEYTNARDDNPETDKAIYTMTLPSLSLSVKQLTLGRQLRSGQQGSFFGNVGRNTYFTQGYSMSQQRNETESTQTKRYTANGNWGLTVRPPRISIFNLNFGASSSWNWTRTDLAGLRYAAADSTWSDIGDVTELSRPSLSFNSGLSTTLYGIFPVRVGPLQAIRHTLRVSGGASYRPQLGSKQTRGSSYSLSASNRFDVKYLSNSGQDTAQTVRKLDGLIDWSLNTSYNPDAQREWSDISSGLTFKPGQSRNLAFKLNNVIDPYLWKITRTQFNYSFGFNGRVDTGYAGLTRQEERSEAYALLGEAVADTLVGDEAAAELSEWDQPASADGSFYGGYFDEFAPAEGGSIGRDETEGGRYIPWNVGGSVSLSHTAGSDRTTARASLSGAARLTHDWEFRYSASFDLEARSTTRQEYRLQRDLHCWRLEFTRIVSPQESLFGFRFYLKAIPEVKLTRGKEDLLGSTGDFGSFF